MSISDTILIQLISKSKKYYGPISIVTIIVFLVFLLLSIIARAYPEVYIKNPILFNSDYTGRSYVNYTFIFFLFILLLVTGWIIVYVKGERNVTYEIIDAKKSDNSKLIQIQDDLEKIKKQILFESEKISRYSYINLGIGFVTTVLAIFILYLTLSDNTIPYGGSNTEIVKEISQFSAESELSVKPVILTNDNTNSVATIYLMHIIPRVSLSILIEIFAFFFLKLYRNNLNEIKYYNNEIVNIKMKIIALKTAAIYETDNLEEIIKKFAETERNFILKKDETTVDLQKNIIESNNSNKIIETLTSLLKSK